MNNEQQKSNQENVQHEEKRIPIEHAKSLLYRFWQRSSDACPLEATEAEQQEKDFAEWVEETYN